MSNDDVSSPNPYHRALTRSELESFSFNKPPESPRAVHGRGFQASYTRTHGHHDPSSYGGYHVGGFVQSGSVLRGYGGLATSNHRSHWISNQSASSYLPGPFPLGTQSSYTVNSIKLVQPTEDELFTADPVDSPARATSNIRVDDSLVVQPVEADEDGEDMTNPMLALSIHDRATLDITPDPAKKSATAGAPMNWPKPDAQIDVNHHESPAPNLSNIAPRPYKCPVVNCGKAYKTQAGLRYHKNVGH
jgi:hypothetical protein